MNFTRSSLCIVAAFAVGCLPGEKPVEGRLLVAGRQIEEVQFLPGVAPALVQFEARTAFPAAGKAGAADVWLVGWQDGISRKLMANKSDRWAMAEAGPGSRYIMHDEKLMDAGGTAGVTVPVATLTRVSLTAGVEDEIPDVASFAPVGDLLLYRRPAPGSAFPELHLRTKAARDVTIGRTSGAAQFGGQGHFFCVLGEERVLSRLTSLGAVPEPLRAHVARFMLTPDERFAIVSVVDAGKPQVLSVNLETLAETKIPGQPCCWLQLGAVPQVPGQPTEWVFSYSESARAQIPGKLHAYNLVTGGDQILSLPSGLSEVGAILSRPVATTSLLLDNQGHMALFDAASDSPPRVLDLKAASPTFTSDGRFLLYVDPDPLSTLAVEGALMVRDADFLQPARMISPKGSTVRAGDFFFINGAEPLVFWARFTRGGSDLYFASPENGISRLVAPGISRVSVTPRRVVGILRTSEQDLVGDLVRRDAKSGDELVLAYTVADVAFGPFDAALGATPAAFVVRGRMPSNSDGLWASVLPP